MTEAFHRLDVNDIRSLQGMRVLVVGDVMLDAYLTGEANRISPEAPVPVVRILEERYYLGGAGNVAANISALGGIATLMGLTGRDSAADTFNGLLENLGIRPQLLQVEDRPTTVKTRVLASRQQMLRMDYEHAGPLSQADRARFMDVLRCEAGQHDIVILSDYAKGLVDAEFAEALRKELDALPRPVKLLVDPKPAHFVHFADADLLTPNLKETSESVTMPVGNREEILAAGREIFRRFRCRQLLSTLGPQGMALFLGPDEVWHIPTVARDVFDVTGAGDTVIATVGLGLAAGLPLLEACVLANYAAGIVVGRVGAATVTPDELEDFIRQQKELVPQRWA